MILDGITADERKSIGKQKMKQPKISNWLVMVALILTTVTGGFGLYQDRKGDFNDVNNSMVRTGVTQGENA